LLPLCLQYVANSYGYYFFITWLPTYLAKARGMSSAELAIFSGLPLTLSAIADVTGGFTTDALCRRFGVRAGTCGVGVLSYVLAAAAMLAGTLASQSARRRNADRRRRSVFDVHPGAQLVDRHRPGRPKHGITEFRDEHLGPGGRVL
jgi:nitrate/nitrite transporter NarK